MNCFRLDYIFPFFPFSHFEESSTRTASSWVFLLRLKYNRKIDTDVVRMVGKQKSIGLLIMASGSAEDRTIPEDPPCCWRDFNARTPH